MTPQEVKRYVSDYLHAAEQPGPEQEIAFYADRVEYFDSGMVDRKFVANDQERYYRKWPSRAFTLLEEPSVQMSNSSATARFAIKYAVGGAHRTAEGRTEDRMVIRKFQDGWKIVAIDERKIK